MDSTVTLKGITFTVKRWGESDLYTLECPHCHPGVDFAKGETVEVNGTSYLVYLVGDRSINLNRMYPIGHFVPKNTVTLSSVPPAPTSYRRVKMTDLPKDLKPVLALIRKQSDLGSDEWREVVYHDGAQWRGYHGGTQFEDGEHVVLWVYADEALPAGQIPSPAPATADTTAADAYDGPEDPAVKPVSEEERTK